MSRLNLDDLADEIRSNNLLNGWEIFMEPEWGEKIYKVPAILALIHSEVSEALEDYRKGDKEHFIEEMADIIIRVLDLVGGFGSVIDHAIRAKIERNKGRGFRHGGKRV
jgi:NTP pyrophosphatase (non-canonical NTP hydrolase)